MAGITKGEIMRGKKNDLPVTQEANGVISRETRWGDMASSFDTMPKGLDMASMLKGLPDDACQCPHWGYLTKGRMRVRYTDGTEETVNEGDAFYMRPGHVPYIEEAVEWVMFSPPDKIKETRDAIARNAESRKERAA